MTESDFRLILMATHTGEQVGNLCTRMKESSYEELSDWLASLIRSTDTRIRGHVIEALMQRVLTVMDERVSDLRDEAMYAGMGEDL